MQLRPLVAPAVALLSLVAAPAFAQQPIPSIDLPRPSPLGKVSQMVGVTEVTVEWSSPAVKGRKIWGALVPFDQLWRTGANSATKVTFSKDVKLDGKPVPAGSYALFTIPGKDAWTVILNKNVNQGGTREYKQELDAIRLTVKPATLPASRERLTFLFSDTTESSTSLDMEWEKLRLSLPIKAATDEQIAANLKGLSDNAWRPWNNAARYLMEEKKDYDQALALVEKSLLLKEDWLNVWTKAQILAAKGKHKEAYPLAEKANALGQKAEYFFFADDVKKALADWKGK